MIPIFRAKSNERKNTYVEGLLIGVDEELNLCTIRTKDDYIGGEVCYLHTLSINFPDMLDSQGNKIFASLSESVTEIIGFKTFEAILGEVGNKTIDMVLNNIHPLQKDFTSVEAAIQNNNSTLLKTIIRQRKTYKTVLTDGKSVFESNDEKAKEEIRGLRDELFK